MLLKLASEQIVKEKEKGQFYSDCKCSIPGL